MVAEPFFSTSIHGAAWLVKYKNWRIMQEGSGQCHDLALPPGQAPALFANGHVKTGTVFFDYLSYTR